VFLKNRDIISAVIRSDNNICYDILSFRDLCEVQKHHVTLLYTRLIKKEVMIFFISQKPMLVKYFEP